MSRIRAFSDKDGLIYCPPFGTSGVTEQTPPDLVFEEVVFPPPKEQTDGMKTKAAVPCQGDSCSRDAVSTHAIHYRGLRFHLSLCEEHGTALKAAEGTEAPLPPSPASDEVLRITQGQETIAQICYAHGRPSITIAFPEEIPTTGLQEENEPASVLLPTA